MTVEIIKITKIYKYTGQLNFMHPIKVLHYRDVWLGVTQRWLYTIISCLPEFIESHIACERTENPSSFSLPNIHALSNTLKIHRNPNRFMRKYIELKHNATMADTLRKCNAAILHSHFGEAGVSNSRAAEKTGVRHVVSFYGHEIGRLTTRDPVWKTLFREMFRNVDMVVCEGPRMAVQINKMGCSEEKIFVNPIGVEIDSIKFQQRIFKPGAPPRFLIAASFREKKGIPCALEAISLINKETPVEITIIGDAVPGSRDEIEKKRIIRTINETGLSPYVRMLGYQPYSVLMEEAYNHHIFVSPSLTASDGDTEGGAPVTIIDMAASGMPVVSTRHCDIPEIIINGKTGLLSDEGDPEGLYENIKALLEAPEKCEEFALSARKHVEENFSSRIQSKKLGEFYRKLVEG